MICWIRVICFGGRTRYGHGLDFLGVIRVFWYSFGQISIYTGGGFTFSAFLDGIFIGVGGSQSGSVGLPSVIAWYGRGVGVERLGKLCTTWYKGGVFSPASYYRILQL